MSGKRHRPGRWRESTGNSRGEGRTARPIVSSACGIFGPGWLPGVFSRARWQFVLARVRLRNRVWVDGCPLAAPGVLPGAFCFRSTAAQRAASLFSFPLHGSQLCLALHVLAEGHDSSKIEPDADWKIVSAINTAARLTHALVRIDPSEKDPQSDAFEIASIRKALATLRRAINVGLKDAARLEQDKDWDSLRGAVCCCVCWDLVL